MFKCAWCMRNIGEDDSLVGLDIKFAEGIDFSEDEGTITQIFLQSRNTSVPMIVTASGSEAKKNGQDGIFPLCSDTCAEKMRNTLEYEKETFKSWS